MMKKHLLTLLAIGAISALTFVGCRNSTTPQVTPDPDPEPPIVQPDPDAEVVDGVTEFDHEESGIEFTVLGGLTRGQVNAIIAMVQGMDLTEFADYISSVTFDPALAGFTYTLTGEQGAQMADVRLTHLANADAVNDALTEVSDIVQTANQPVPERGSHGDDTPIAFSHGEVIIRGENLYPSEWEGVVERVIAALDDDFSWSSYFGAVISQFGPITIVVKNTDEFDNFSTVVGGDTIYININSDNWEETFQNAFMGIDGFGPEIGYATSLDDVRMAMLKGQEGAVRAS